MLKLRTILILLLSLMAWDSLANALLGGNISFECLGNGDYEITLNIYEDCFGDTTPEPNKLLLFEPANGCATSSFFPALAVFSEQIEISELCINEINQSSCNPGEELPGTTLTTYTTIVNLDPTCTWTVSWAEQDFNWFQNADIPNFNDAHFTTIIDPIMGCNSSIDLEETFQIPYGVMNQLMSHQIEFTPANAANDVTFTQVIPQTEQGNSTEDLAGYDGTGFTVSSTGLIEFTPSEIGNFSVAVEITETDPGGNILYTMTEYLAFRVREAIEEEPFFTPGQGIGEPISVIGADFIQGQAMNLTPDTLVVCAGDSVCLFFESIHENLTTLDITSDIFDHEPAAVLLDSLCPTPQGTGSQACAELCWTVTNTNQFSFDVIVEDGDCDDPGRDTISLVVSPSSGIPVLSYFTTDITICEGETALFGLETDTASDQVLSVDYSTQVIGSPMITQSTVDPYNETDLIAVTPTEDTQYCILSVQDSDGCQAELDANQTCINVEVNPLLTSTSTDDSFVICEGTNQEIDLELAGTAPFDVYYTQTTTESGYSQSLSAELQAMDLWNLSPDSSVTIVLDSIVDSAPLAACTIYPESNYSIEVQNFTQVSLSADSITCENGDFNILFDFESFTGPDFDIDLEVTPLGSPAIPFTVEVSVGDLVDSTHTVSSADFLAGGIQTLTSIEVISILDSGTSCISSMGVSTAEAAVAPTSTATLSGSQMVCEGDTLNANIALTGVGPWSLNIENSNGGSSSVIIASDITDYSLPLTQEGIYSITSFTDSLSCDGNAGGTAEYTSIALPEASLSTDGIICSGQNETVDIDITQGTGSFDVEIEDPNGVSIFVTAGLALGDSAFVASAAGDYTLISIEDDNCINDNLSAATISLNSVNSPEIALTSSGFICDQDSSLLEIVFTGGTAPFEFTLQNVTNMTEEDINLNSNSYSDYLTVTGEYNVINATDANECSGTITSGSETLVARLLPTADAGPDENDCANTTVTIGTPDMNGYSYQWTSDNSAILDTVYTDLAEIVLINDTGVDQTMEAYLEVYDNFCYAYDTVQVTISSAPSIDAGDDVFVCFGDPVTLDGSGNGTLTWVNNGNLSDYAIPNPMVLNTQATDTFVLNVQDVMDPFCVGIDSVIVTVNPEITTDLTITSDVCFNTCTGEISGDYLGGTPTLTATWTDSNGAVMNTLNNLCPDTYTLVIEDDNNCTYTEDVTINELPEYFLTDVILTDPVCFGDENGVITINATDATEYTLESMSQSSATFNELNAGEYMVSATNSTGCIADSTVTLTSNPELFIQTAFENTIICIGEEVIFEATASGGVNDFEYFWIPNTGDFNTNTNTVSTFPTENILTEVYALDDNGQCSTDTLSMTATFASEIAVEVSEDITICQGETAVLEGIPSGGAGDLSCSWNSPGTIDQESCIIEVSPLANTVYTFTSEDNCAAPASASVSVTVLETPSPSFSVDTVAGCYPLSVNFTNTSDPAFIGDCVWDYGNGTEELNCSEIVSFSYLIPGTFTPTLTLISENGCEATTVESTEIIAHGFPLANFTYSPDPPTILEPEVQFINQSIGATSYYWESLGSFTSVDPNPFVELQPEALSTYNVCLTATNNFGCSDTLCQLVTINGIVTVHVPSAFTPDYDSFNDVFVPRALGIDDDNYQFTIFNRQGEIVFQSFERNEPWDGSMMNGDYFVPDGVYTWILKVQDIMTADIKEFKGFVTIMR